MALNTSIVVVTHFPSPYQVELFNEVDRQRPECLKVYYLFRRSAARRWRGIPLTHTHEYLDAQTHGASVHTAMKNASLVVFNYYNDPLSAALIRERDGSGHPWCFWGERPGYRFPVLARIARHSRLAPLRRSCRPIWGIGRWAVDGYQAEFGDQREYLNLPYYSDLARFEAIAPTYSSDVTFLFSGSLILRKGPDLLVEAFRKVLERHPNVRLLMLGEGPMESQLAGLLRGDPRVEWLGFRDWEDLPDMYRRAHVLCVPSRHDGWGLVVPEGLASGLPVIASDRTGAALDLVRPHHNGWLVTAGDADALARAMIQAVRLDVDEWCAMSSRARASVHEHSLSRGAQRFLSGADHAMGNAG